MTHGNDGMEDGRTRPQAPAIAQRLADVRTRITAAAQAANRDANAVTLVAVSKKHTTASIEAAYAAGQRLFGESYVDELEGKMAALSHLSEIRFRFIGHLQRNKAKRIAALNVPVDSVDSLRLAQALHRARQHEEGPPLPILVQLKLIDEPSKAGISAEALPELLAAVGELSTLRVQGLMTLPPPDKELATAAFAKLAALADHHALPVRSMGMSGDLEEAIQAGATHVRVGTAIFGTRQS